MSLAPARTETQRQFKQEMLKSLPTESIQALGSICKNALDNPKLKMTANLRRKVAAQRANLLHLANSKLSPTSRRKYLLQQQQQQQQSGGALPLLPLLFSLLPPVASFVGSLVSSSRN